MKPAIIGFNGDLLNRPDILEKTIVFAKDHITSEEGDWLRRNLKYVPKEDAIGKRVYIHRENGKIVIYLDETPVPIEVTKDWLTEIGFSPDKMGVLTLGALHIDLDKQNSYIRSYPIPTPQCQKDVLELIRLLGLK